jgi:hypothetical protein
MFENLLLTNHAKKKLAILTYLNKRINQPVNISKIAEHLGLSYHGIAPLIEEMQVEFSTLYKISLCEKGFKVRSLKAPLSYTRYQKYLIKESLAFRLLLTSIREPELSINDFSTIHFVSHSTITRALKPLKTYLAKKDINLNVYQLKLTGNEINIRSFYVQLLAFLENEPLQAQYLADLEEQKELMDQLALEEFTVVTQQQISILLVVTKLRLEQGYTLDPIHGFEKLFAQMNQPLRTYFSKFVDDEEQLIYQMNYFKGALFLLVRFSDPIPEKSQLLHNFYDHIKQDVPIFHELMLDFQQSLLVEAVGLPVDADLFAEIQKNSFIILYILYANQGRVIDFWAYHDLNQTFQKKGFSDLQKKIRPFLTKYTRRVGYEWLKNAKPAILDHLTFFIYPYYQQQHLQKLQVGIVPSLNLAMTQQICFLLDQVNFVDYDFVQNLDTRFDYYIVPASRRSPALDQPAFLLRDVENIQQLTPLLDDLWKEYLLLNDLGEKQK